MPVKNATALVANATRLAATNTKRRADLEVGDLYQLDNSNNVYMHTGVRTQPPSAGRGTGQYAPNGDVIVGWQGLRVKGKVKPTEDGAVFTTDGNKAVKFVGRATLTLGLFA